MQDYKNQDKLLLHLQININPAYKSDELRYALNLVGVKALAMAPKFRNMDLLAILKEAVPELEMATQPPVSSKSVPSLKHVISLTHTENG